MKNQIITAISTIVGLVALWLLFSNFPLTWEDFSNLNPYLLILWLFVTVLLMLTHAWRWKMILDASGNKVSIHKLFVYKVIGSSVSYFTPSAKLGGEPVRALLLKRQKVPLKNGLSSVVIDKVIELASSGAFFVIGALVLLFTTVLPAKFQIILVFAIALIVWLIYTYYKKVFDGQLVLLGLFRKFNLHNIRRLKKYEAKVKDFEKLIIVFFRDNKKTFVYSILLSALTWVFMIIEYKIAVSLLGLNLGFMEVFLIFSFVGLAYIIPVPMSLGSLEASQVGVFRLLGIKAQSGLALSVLVRARDFIWGIIGLIMLSFYGFSIRKTFEEDTRIDEEITKIR